MRPSLLTLTLIDILLLIVSLSYAQSIEQEETHLIKRGDNDEAVNKILAKALDKCTCYGAASLSPGLCVSNCLHTMNPLHQQEALDTLETGKEFAAYVAVMGLCTICAQAVHMAWVQHRRQMRREREEYRRRRAQEVHDQRAQFYEDEIQDERGPNHLNEDGHAWTNAPQPMEQMDYQGGHEIMPMHDEVIDNETQQASTSGGRRRIKGSSSHSQGRMMD